MGSSRWVWVVELGLSSQAGFGWIKEWNVNGNRSEWINQRCSPSNNVFHVFVETDFFVKVMIFLLDVKYKTYKSATVRASPDIRIREKFTVPLTSTQLKDSTISFQVFLKLANKKKIIQKITVGRTVIGPYMRHGDRTLSQWEKMLTTNTSEEVDEQHILYL